MLVDLSKTELNLLRKKRLFTSLLLAFLFSPAKERKKTDEEWPFREALPVNSKVTIFRWIASGEIDRHIDTEIGERRVARLKIDRQIDGE